MFVLIISLLGFPSGTVVKDPPANVGDARDVRDVSSNPELTFPGNILSGIFPGEGNGNPLQYSCLENSMDRKAWQATVLRVI